MCFVIVRRGPIRTAAGIRWSAPTRVWRAAAAARLWLPAAVLSAWQHQGRKQILLGWATTLWVRHNWQRLASYPVLALHSMSEAVQCSAWLLTHTHPVASTRNVQCACLGVAAPQFFRYDCQGCNSGQCSCDVQQTQAHVVRK